MSVENVRSYLSRFHAEDRIQEFDVSSATVELAAEALSCPPAWIAKTISLKNPEGNAVLVVAAGDVKIDNQKFKAEFGYKAKMLQFDEVLPLTGHPVGGVCPFATAPGVTVFLDESLRRFPKVYPACGSANSAIGLTCEELQTFSGSDKWVDVCKSKEA